MVIEQIYTGCLFQGAYYIESKGEVAIVDPLREPDTYIEKAKKNNSNIKYIFETHIHADFVSGHLSLSKLTGAPIIFGPNASLNFDCIIAKDYQEFKLGDIILQLIHTPGHTLESSTLLLKDVNGNKIAIFTGDTLFLGDVGRPDLAQKSKVLNQNELAGMLYDSLREKIMPLPDELIVYPAHGAGSACGKKMMKETFDTLGNQKKINYALRKDMTKGEFINEVLSGLDKPPEYFAMNVKLNQEGYDDLSAILEKSLQEIDYSDFEQIANASKSIILDVRNENDYVLGHIPKSIFIGINGSFAPWVGALIKDVKQSILLVTPLGKEKETITRLSRVGFDNVLGYLKGGFEEWKSNNKSFDSIKSLSAKFLFDEKINPLFFDVRNIFEHEDQHLDNSINTPLNSLNDYIEVFPNKNLFYIYCAGGYRSVIAISILKRKGIHNAINIKGGYPALKNSGFSSN